MRGSGANWIIWARRLMLSCLAVGLAALAGLMLFAPQVFTLYREGFPAPVWPAPGRFAQVDGPGLDMAAGAGLNGAAGRRFSDSEGRALLVWQGGTLVTEHYAAGITRETRLNSYSMVKSLVGVLVVKAVAEGRIAGFDTALPDLIGRTAPRVTLGELMTMTSGLQLRGEPPKQEVEKPLDDARFSPLGPVGRLHAFGVERILPGLRSTAEMRGRFHYQSVNTALLGLALERAYGQPLEQILSEQIWAPAGAAPAQWRRNPGSGRVSAYCCLYARGLDWALVGGYLLSNGHPEAPLLPEDFWRAWILPDLAAARRRQGAYGWQIRHNVLDRAGETLSGPFAYMAGHAGQRTYFLPQRDAVILRFGARPQLLHSTLYELFPGP